MSFRPSRTHWEKRKVKIYQFLYEFTFNQCGRCVETGCACKDSICAHVGEQARKKGVDLKPTGHALRFIGERGCVVPPHLRETCTIFLCEKAQNRFDFDRQRYGRLKKICERIEWNLLRIEAGLI